MGSLTYNGDLGLLVGTNDGTGSFYGIDPMTGGQTLLNGGSGFINNSDLAYDSTAGAYWVLDYSGNFYQYDAATYSRTLLAATGRNFDGLVLFDGVMGAVPEPATWAFMIFGFGAVGGAMRSKNRRLRRKANVKLSYA